MTWRSRVQSPQRHARRGLGIRECLRGLAHISERERTVHFPLQTCHDFVGALLRFLTTYVLKELAKPGFKCSPPFAHEACASAAGFVESFELNSLGLIRIGKTSLLTKEVKSDLVEECPEHVAKLPVGLICGEAFPTGFLAQVLVMGSRELNDPEDSAVRKEIIRRTL